MSQVWVLNGTIFFLFPEKPKILGIFFTLKDGDLVCNDCIFSGFHAYQIISPIQVMEIPYCISRVSSAQLVRASRISQVWVQYGTDFFSFLEKSKILDVFDGKRWRFGVRWLYIFRLSCYQIISPIQVRMHHEIYIFVTGIIKYFSST